PPIPEDMPREMVLRTSRLGCTLLRGSRGTMASRSSRIESAQPVKSQSFRFRWNRLTEPTTRAGPPATGPNAGTISHQRRADLLTASVRRSFPRGHLLQGTIDDPVKSLPN